MYRERSQKTKAEYLIYGRLGLGSFTKKRGTIDKNYHFENIKEIKRRKQEFDRRQQEIEQIKRINEHKLKRFALNDIKAMKELRNDFMKRSKSEMKVKNYIRKNISEIHSRKMEEKHPDNIYSLNPCYGRVPK